jgi:RNA polymerase sigma-70 factor (ECF subfamily)
VSWGPSHAMPHSSILERCRFGETGAWRLVFEQYVHSVYRWALCFGIDQAGAEELTQEVFATAMKSIDKCPSEALLPAWLFQITRRLAANLRRSVWFSRVLKAGGAREVGPPSGTSPGVAGNPYAHELGLDLRRALRKMPAKLVEVLVLADLEGYARDEIARLLGIPEGTVASRLHKARAMIERELG